MNMFSELSNAEQGSIGEAQAVLEYTKLGYTVSLPAVSTPKFDLIVDKDGVLSRIQVKTSSYQKSSGSWEVALATSGGNRSGKGKVTYIDDEYIAEVFIMTGDGNCYKIPSKDLEGKGQITVSPTNKWAKYII